MPLSQKIQTYVDQRTLTVDQAMGLTLTGRFNLESEPIRGLIADGTLTLAQAMGLNEQGRMALNDEPTRQRLRQGELTIQHIMGVQIPALVNINDAQSTHTASVHRTVSESATRLLDRYGTTMNASVLDGLITRITGAINALPSDNPKNEAAKRCVARLAAPDYVYTDLTSGVNTRELLALSWLALHDEKMCTASLEDATRLFIEGLYEIQRGNNLSETGADLHGGDINICSGGTFNKLLEKLNGVHPDVVIEVITLKLAALKFPIVVKEEVKHYLADKANPATFSEFNQFTHQIKQIEEEGVDVIWGSIKDHVAARMFDEFGSLYVNQDDPRFTAFMDTAQYIELGELPSFQKELSESEGYRKYCSSMMRSPGLFFGEKTQGQDSGSSPSDKETGALKPRG